MCLFDEDRTLQEALAVELFGFVELSVPPDAFGQHGGGTFLAPPNHASRGAYWLPPKGPIAHDAYVPRYTHTIEAAMSVVNGMQQHGYGWTIRKAPDAPWDVTCTKVSLKPQATDGTLLVGMAGANCLPLALCQAAGAVLGGACRAALHMESVT